VAAHVNVNKVSIAPTLVMILSPRATRALIAKFVNPGITGTNRMTKSQAQTFHNGPWLEIQTVMKQAHFRTHHQYAGKSRYQHPLYQD
jgi:hypothetical protein